MLRFEEITPENWRCDIRVSREQARFVADRTAILARAWAYRKENARVYLLMRDETPVGVALWYDAPEGDAYVFSELFIDERYQHQGLGRQAAAMVLDEMAAEARHPEVILCYVAGNEAARAMYAKLGFRPCDDDEEEPGMSLSLDDWRASQQQVPKE